MAEDSGVAAGVSKLAAEQHLRAAAEYFGLEYIILRVHSAYGPNMDFEPARSSLIARAVASVRPPTSRLTSTRNSSSRISTFVHACNQVIGRRAGASAC